VLLAVMLGLGCAAESRGHSSPVSMMAPGEPATTRGDGAGDSAWLARARDTHAFVDSAIGTERADEAKRRLQTLVEAPAGGIESPRVKDLRRDSFARLAEVEMLQGMPARALVATQAGLALDNHADVITAQLRFWRARAREALGDSKAAEEEFALCRAIAKSKLSTP